MINYEDFKVVAHGNCSVFTYKGVKALKIPGV